MGGDILDVGAAVHGEHGRAVPEVEHAAGMESKPADRRELYYSEVDRRIHLFGAEEGWIEIGHFGGLGRIGEIRMFDTDRNGYFDRWEVYLAGKDEPVRVTAVRDERARRIDFDMAKLTRFYADEVLPGGDGGQREAAESDGGGAAVRSSRGC